MSSQKTYQSKLVSNARAILTNQVAIPLGVRRMKNLIYWASQTHPVNSIDLSIFENVDKQISGCPVGSERLKWEKEALKSLDKLIDPVIIAFREAITDKCFEIIEKLDK
jgi:hypothetical protein